MVNTFETNSPSLSRRGLLKAAGLGAGVAGAAAVGLASGHAGADQASPKKSNRDVAGYRETEHVKSYYAMARL